ncbi:MAG TPA: SurA N-terminal domain-containing protein [Sphingopyxis sp.]|nr:SurA N-terminal domain-containing protein [Sphingopyxis sp.]HMP46570.1 SurA N-terminal domain-containing protein [Sphingopyxis sp.]
MITAIRRLFSSALGKFIALAFVGLVGLAFALGDVTGMSNFSGFGGGGNNIARVGDEDIGYAELREQVRRDLEQARQQQPGLSMEAYIEGGGLQQSLDKLIDGLAFHQYARELGFGINKRLVDGRIADIPVFAGVTGQFDQTRYAAFLRDNRITEAQLRADIEGQLFAEQLAAPVGAMPRVGQGMAMPYAALPLEERRGEAVFIPASSFAPASDPGDAALQTYLTQNRTRFSIPERRVIQYAVFDRAIAPAPAVTDKEIADLYKANAERFAASETRRFMQVIAPDQATANAIAARVRGGTPLTAAATAAGLSAASTGTVTQSAYAALTNTAAARTAFAAGRGDVLGPTQTGLGWTVAQVDAITVTPAKTLAEATPEIRAQLEQAKANEGIFNFYNAIQDAVNGGAAIEEIAETNKLTLVETPALLPSGRSPAQPGFALAPEFAPLLAQAFQGGEEGEAHLATLVENEKFAVYAIKSIVAAAPPPFAQIRADLLADWKLAQGQRAARDKARALIKAVEGGQGFAEAARAAGPNIGTVQTIGGRRGELGAGGQPIPPELALLFSMAEGSVKTLEVPGNRGWMVLSLAKVNRPDPKAVDPEIVASVAGQLGPAFGNELVTQMMADARKRVGVQINDKLLEQLRKELTGDLPVAE